MGLDRLDSIAAFVKVDEEGNFAAAGGELRIFSSAKSKSVARLEERLGVRLFHPLPEG